MQNMKIELGLVNHRRKHIDFDNHKLNIAPWSTRWLRNFKVLAPQLKEAGFESMVRLLKSIKTEPSTLERDNQFLFATCPILNRTLPLSAGKSPPSSIFFFSLFPVPPLALVLSNSEFSHNPILSSPLFSLHFTYDFSSGNSGNHMGMCFPFKFQLRRGEIVFPSLRMALKKGISLVEWTKTDRSFDTHELKRLLLLSMVEPPVKPRIE